MDDSGAYPVESYRRVATPSSYIKYFLSKRCFCLTKSNDCSLASSQTFNWHPKASLHSLASSYLKHQEGITKTTLFSIM